MTPEDMLIFRIACAITIAKMDGHPRLISVVDALTLPWDNLVTGTEAHATPCYKPAAQLLAQLTTTLNV